jgi:hypothetical protein
MLVPTSEINVALLKIGTHPVRAALPSRVIDDTVQEQLFSKADQD